MRVLLHPRVRSAFREAASDCGVVRQIERAFEDEGFDPAGDDGRNWYSSGQRRGTFDRCTASVDWSDVGQVRRVLNVFEEILRWPAESAYRLELVRHLEREGYSVDDAGRIRGRTSTVLAEIPLEHLTNSPSIEEHVDRIAATSDTDPGTAISGAKALIEATTKLVLSEPRNQYGVDHGRTTAVVALSPRHAHLAVGSAATYCRMLLETLAARTAASE